jgi:hypothetical protein
MIKYIMSGSGLNYKSNRAVRYEQRCQKKRIEQQNIDRNMRAEKRIDMIDDVSKEVTNEISMIKSTRREHLCRNASKSVSFSPYF